MGKIAQPLDILVPSHERTFKSVAFRCHLCSNELPPHGLRQLTDHVYVTSPELTFVHMGALLTEVQLALVGMMLCGSYAIAPTEDRRLLKRKPLTTVRDLQAMVDAASQIRGTKTARRALRLCLEESRSPRESVSPLLLCLPGTMGGYGLETPELNRKVDLSSEAARIVGVDAITPDLCWYDHKTLMEYDSWDNHNNDRQLAGDDLKVQAYLKDRWTVVTMRPANMNSPAKFDAIVRGVIAPALGADIPVQDTSFMRLRSHLRDEIMAFDPYVSPPVARARLQEIKDARASIRFGESSWYA